jgi:hypothetical protein
MKAILEFNLPEDKDDFELATQGSRLHSVIWEMDQWLRAQYKYMSDEEYSADKYETYEKCREKLRDLVIENKVDLEI